MKRAIRIGWVLTLAASVTGQRANETTGARALRLGRALFAAGKYREAVPHLAVVVERQTDASAAELFRLARCHEALYQAAEGARRVALAARERAESKLRALTSTSRRSLTTGGESGSTELGGDAVRAAAALERSRTAAEQERQTQTKTVERELQAAERHFEQAHDLYQRVEREDVVVVAGKPQPGRWAGASQAGRLMLRWRRRNGAWRPVSLRRVGVQRAPN